MRDATTRRAVTLIEIMVVVAIIAILLGLLLLAISSSRESARRATCQGNLHQLAIALTHFVDCKKLPDPAEDGKIGGWAIAILPFMEETVLADGLSGNPPLASPSPLDLARKRPFIMACPSAYEGDSIIATVPTSHYSAILTRKGLPKLAWQLGELPTDSRIPWVISPEAPSAVRPQCDPTVEDTTRYLAVAGEPMALSSLARADSRAYQLRSRKSLASQSTDLSRAAVKEPS